MEIKIPVQELSDGRFRNVITGKIGDSIKSVVKDYERTASEMKEAIKNALYMHPEWQQNRWDRTYPGVKRTVLKSFPNGIKEFGYFYKGVLMVKQVE